MFLLIVVPLIILVLFFSYHYYSYQWFYFEDQKFFVNDYFRQNGYYLIDYRELVEKEVHHNPFKTKDTSMFDILLFSNLYKHKIVVVENILNPKLKIYWIRISKSIFNDKLIEIRELKKNESKKIIKTYNNIAEVENKCPACQFEIKPSDNFCPNCKLNFIN